MILSYMTFAMLVLENNRLIKKRLVPLVKFIGGTTDIEIRSLEKFFNVK
jgi:hypothetical protein